MVNLRVRYEVVSWPDRFKVVIREVFKPADNRSVFDSRLDAQEAVINQYSEWLILLQNRRQAASDKLARDLRLIELKR